MQFLLRVEKIGVQEYSQFSYSNVSNLRSIKAVSEETMSHLKSLKRPKGSCTKIWGSLRHFREKCLQIFEKDMQIFLYICIAWEHWLFHPAHWKHQISNQICLWWLKTGQWMPLLHKSGLAGKIFESMGFKGGVCWNKITRGSWPKKKKKKVENHNLTPCK